jgi:hypothetical protein
VLVAALAACTGGPAPEAPRTSTAPEPTSTVLSFLSGAEHVRAGGAAVPVGEVELWVRGLGTAPGTAPGDDGDVRLAVTTAESGPGTTLVPLLDLAGPPGSTVEVLQDDSAVVRDEAGTVLAGIGTPVLDDDARAAGARVQVAQDSADSLTWRLQQDAVVRTDGSVEDGTVPAASVAGIVSAGALGSATWRDLDDEGGRSLAVVPTAWARTGTLAAEELLWAQLAAQEPDAATQAVRDQLTCHVIGAPDKESWNLEPWRPDVGLLATLAARCNPS